MYFCLVVFETVAAIMDYFTYKIKNCWIVFGIVSGIVTAVHFGNLESSVLGVLLAFAILIIPYVLGGLGAGDVKMFMVIGCFLKPYELLKCILITCIIGVMGSLFKMMICKDMERGKNIRLAIPGLISVLIVVFTEV